MELPGLNRGKTESHPGRPLEDHLLQTACLAEKIASYHLGRAPVNLRAACLIHDTAKAHAKFQDRLKGKGRFPHAEPSAFIALALTRDIIMAEVIRCHHTHINNNFINDFWCNTNYREIRNLLAEIPLWPGSKKITAELGIDCAGWKDLLPSSEDWDDLLGELEDNTSLDVYNWLDLRLLYSLMITADRLDAIGGVMDDISLSPLNVAGNIVEKHLKKLKPTPLTLWRNQIRDEVLKGANETISGPGVYTLTLPTGAGKTLLGLDLALKIIHQQGKEGIIYVLPFITIVEQNSEVAKSIFPTVQEDHHLAYDGTSEDQDVLQRFVSLFRYWNEPVVVSTFAKLWEVLYSPRSNDSMSFHRLANSVVLLDEPQSIPARYWKGFGNTLEFIASHLNTTFILITATQPGIARGKEIAPANIRIPKCRYTATFLNEPISVDQMLDTVVKHGLPARNTMIVANTRRAALDILFSIRERKVIAEVPFFLSSWVTPADRKKTMAKIRSREEKRIRRYLVSTQVVEAGVDLDFDLVARDFAPLDSLIQVAGRCNRHMSDNEGQFLIFEVINDERKKYVTRVYDSVLINFTRGVLEEYKKENINNSITFSELDVPVLLKNYYTRLSGSLEDCGPWFDIEKGKWGSWYSLIDEQIYENTVFIDHNGEIKSIIEELNSIGNKLEDRDKRRRLWQKIQEYAISVPEKELDHWYDVSGAFVFDDEEKAIEKIHEGLWIINPKGIGRIYHQEFGFIPFDIYEQYLKQYV
ncbi:MAG: CRISPR-associated helicase Cas3' [Bacillota bacterium]